MEKLNFRQQAEKLLDKVGLARRRVTVRVDRALHGLNSILSDEKEACLIDLYDHKYHCDSKYGRLVRGDKYYLFDRAINPNDKDGAWELDGYDPTRYEVPDDCQDLEKVKKMYTVMKRYTRPEVQGDLAEDKKKRKELLRALFLAE